MADVRAKALAADARAKALAEPPEPSAEDDEASEDDEAFIGALSADEEAEVRKFAEKLTIVGGTDAEIILKFDNEEKNATEVFENEKHPPDVVPGLGLSQAESAIRARCGTLPSPPCEEEELEEEGVLEEAEEEARKDDSVSASDEVPATTPVWQSTTPVRQTTSPLWHIPS